MEILLDVLKSIPAKVLKVEERVMSIHWQGIQYSYYNSRGFVNDINDIKSDHITLRCIQKFTTLTGGKSQKQRCSGVVEIKKKVIRDILAGKRLDKVNYKRLIGTMLTITRVQTTHQCRKNSNIEEALIYIRYIIETKISDAEIDIKQYGFLVKNNNSEHLYINDHRLDKKKTTKNGYHCEACTKYTSIDPTANFLKTISDSKNFSGNCAIPFYVFYKGRNNLFDNNFWETVPGLLDFFNTLGWPQDINDNQNADDHSVFDEDLHTNSEIASVASALTSDQEDVDMEDRTTRVLSNKIDENDYAELLNFNPTLFDKIEDELSENYNVRAFIWYSICSKYDSKYKEITNDQQSTQCAMKFENALKEVTEKLLDKITQKTRNIHPKIREWLCETESYTQSYNVIMCNNQICQMCGEKIAEFLIQLIINKSVANSIIYTCSSCSESCEQFLLLQTLKPHINKVIAEILLKADIHSKSYKDIPLKLYTIYKVELCDKITQILKKSKIIN